jgi:radical SAM superfamily enzyme YgiQ (UPF0313 family)
MDILIIENVWMGGEKYKLFDKLFLTAFSILPTLHARQIAAITPTKHTIHIVNERYDKIDNERNYDIVNINFTTSTAPRAYEIADLFKKKGITVVLSGLHAAACPQEALQHGDSVLLGRGELNWLNLLADVENNSIKPLYPSVSYNESISIPPSNITLPGFMITAAIEATRGCPYCCDFCPEASIDGGSQFFTRPVKDVIEEIKALPQKMIMFYDSSLTIDTEYTRQLFEEMKGLGKRFFCNGNVNVLANDSEFVQLSREAGCVSWLIGFESISQQTIDEVGKKTNNVDEYRKAITNIHDHGMAVIGCFIFGFDSDTPIIFRDTLRVIKKLGIDICDFCVLTPFPGTKLFHLFEKEKRILTNDWKDYNLKTVVFQPKQMTVEELQYGLMRMYREFYSIPFTFRRILKGLTLGFFPFFLIIARNIIATMNSRILFRKED